MGRFATMLLTLTLAGSPVLAEGEAGLVAHWTFDEGSGNVLHDRSGHNHHGKIQGAKWVKSGDGHALQFDGRDDYVDCGKARGLKFRDSFTLSVWVKHEKVAGWQCYVGDYVGGVSGYVIAQNGGSLHFHNGGANPHVLDVTSPRLAPRVWRHVAAVYDREAGLMRIHLDGVRVVSQNVDGSLDPSLEQSVRIGCYRPGRECFHGTLDEVKLYSRALSAQEIAEQQRADPRATEMRKMRRMVLEPFFYPDRYEAVAAVNFRNVLPLAEGTKVVAQVARAGAKNPLNSKALNPNAPESEDEGAFSLEGYAPGEYELRVVLDEGAGNVTTERSAFRYPFPPPPPPAGPEEKTVGPLSAAGAAPPDYRVNVQRGGGFTVTVKGKTYRVESSYSYPHGGANRLVAGPRAAGGEPSWKVQVSRADAKSYRVRAQGKYYAIDRHLALEPTRVLVKDTLRNTSDGVVGIILTLACARPNWCPPGRGVEASTVTEQAPEGRARPAATDSNLAETERVPGRRPQGVLAFPGLKYRASVDPPPGPYFRLSAPYWPPPERPAVPSWASAQGFDRLSLRRSMRDLLGTQFQFTFVDSGGSGR